MKRIFPFFKKNYFWVFFLIFVILRLPSLFEPFTYGDEGIYLALGQALRGGRVFYKEIHDNKPPLLYLLAALAGSFKVYRAFYFFWSLIGFGIFYRLAKALFQKNDRAVMAALLVLAVLGAVPKFEGTIANAENFLIYTSSAAFWLLVTKKNWKWAWWWAGVLFSISTLFKVPGAFDFAAAVIVFFLLADKSLKEIIFSFKESRFWLLLAGFAGPIVLTFVYYWSKGALGSYLTAAFGQNIPYLSSWTPEKTQAFSLPLPLIFRGLGVAGVMGILFYWRRRKGITLAVKLSWVWFLMTMLAAVLSSRPYPHYLFQAVPALALAAGLIFSAPRFLKLSLFIFLGGLWWVWRSFEYYRYPTRAYYQNFYSYVLGGKSREEYISFWGGQVEDLYEAAAWLKAHTETEEEIFIWGDHPELYPLAERLPVGRFAAAYHVKDFDKGYKETLTALKKSPPRFFVVFKNERESLNVLFPFLEENYGLMETFGETRIYLRHSSF